MSEDKPFGYKAADGREKWFATADELWVYFMKVNRLFKRNSEDEKNERVKQLLRDMFGEEEVGE